MSWHMPSQSGLPTARFDGFTSAAVVPMDADWRQLRTILGSRRGLLEAVSPGHRRGRAGPIRLGAAALGPRAPLLVSYRRVPLDGEPGVLARGQAVGMT
jgi:hypothetical protein